MKYRKKPVVIEARQYTAETKEELLEWINRDSINTAYHHTGLIVIRTLEGEMNCSTGDWIIKGVNGEFYPCKPDIFGATYELVGRAALAPPPPTPKCPECAAPLHTVRYPGGYLNADQWSSIRAGDFYCNSSAPHKCEPNGGIAYFWKHEVGPSAPTPEPREIRELNPEALRLAVHAYWKDNGDARHNLATAILAYLNAS